VRDTLADPGLVAFPGPAGLTPGCLNQISCGTDYTQRVGRKILMKSLLMRFVAAIDPTANLNSGNVYRIIIYVDLQNNGAAPALADLLQIGGATFSYLSPINLANRDRIKILYDQTLTCPAFNVTNAFGQPSPMSFKVYLPKLNQETIYNTAGNPATPLVTDINTGALMFTIVSQNQDGGCKWNAYFRVRFVDA